MEIGVHDVEIVNNSVVELAGKPAVKLIVAFSTGAEADVLIWLTEKAAGIARTQLKKCGFMVDDRDLIELSENPNLLSGNKVQIVVDEWNGKFRAQIPLSTAPSKKDMARLSGVLRNAKKKDDEAPPAKAPEDEGVPF